MKMKKQNKGITLIALVITVIVLLILAGAAVSIGLNEEDVFNRANKAKTEWNSKVAEENDALDRYKSYLENDPNKIAITATQNGGMVQVSVNVPGNKSLEEATEEEKLQAILDAWKADGAPADLTTQAVKYELGIFTYEEEIEREIENYGITTSEEDTEETKLSNIWEKWKEDDYYSEEKMIEDIEDVRQELQSREADNENTINSELERLEISSIGELATITVKYGEEPIEVYGNKFYAIEEGTYTITASTQSGKHGETTINVDYGGLARIQIDGMREPVIALYDATSIRTWDQFVESEYNTIGMYWYSSRTASLAVIAPPPTGYRIATGNTALLDARILYLNDTPVGKFDEIIMESSYSMSRHTYTGRLFSVIDK